MFTINIIKADYEGWWLFDDWPEHIIVIYEFETKKEMTDFYQTLILQMKDYFDCYNTGKYKMITFFNNCDVAYCEDCDEDLQMYISPIMKHNSETIRDATYYNQTNLINSY